MLSVPVQDPSQVAEARRQTTSVAQGFGLKETDAGRVALATTELATNLLKHASGGEILVGTYEDNTGSGVEVLALDRGPGMSNVAACIADGYSTAGTAGRGIGAVVRQSNSFDIASWPGVGTAVLARFHAAPPPREPTASAAAWGAVSIAKPGELVCGDGWSVANGSAGRSLLVADGLGHGPEASEAAVEAIRLFNRFNGHRVDTLLDYIHGGLRATRGAAISIARFDRDAGKVIYSGIGNVAGVLAVNGGLRRMVSMAGTAGYNARKIQAFDYPFASGLVIMHSDGLLSSWTLDKYPGAASLHPTLLAGILYRDLSRHRDDATVLVGKW
jgi:anti-sigma regulatory factor (Ser/Thr protein kinase)